MSEIHEVEVTIKPNGEISVEIRGLKGPACVDITRGMEGLLGGKVVDRTHTYEYDEQPVGDMENDWLKDGR